MDSLAESRKINLTTNNACVTVLETMEKQDVSSK